MSANLLRTGYLRRELVDRTAVVWETASRALIDPLTSTRHRLARSEHERLIGAGGHYCFRAEQHDDERTSMPLQLLKGNSRASRSSHLCNPVSERLSRR